jgi:hypothetical protein
MNLKYLYVHVFTNINRSYLPIMLIYDVPNFSKTFFYALLMKMVILRIHKRTKSNSFSDADGGAIY